MDGHGKAKTRIEAGRVPLHGRVDEALDVREVHDLVEAAIDLLAREAEEARAQVDVVAAGELGVEAGAQLDE